MIFIFSLFFEFPKQILIILIIGHFLSVKQRASNLIKKIKFNEFLAVFISLIIAPISRIFQIKANQKRPSKSLIEKEK